MASADEPAGQYERTELHAQLMRSIGGLPEPQRSLVVLFDLQGLSGDECARVLGISISQVKVYLHRARRRLRQRMER
jgi:RNA polymerase sigma-70 factor (ECF subfamily)